MNEYSNESELYTMIRKCAHFLNNGYKLGQKRVIITIYHHQPITQSKLLEVLQVQAGSLSEMLKKLENEGWIIRTNDPEDKRNLHINLTLQGEKMAQEFITLRQEMIDSIFEGFSDEEKKQLHTLLQKLISNWNKHQDENA